MFKRRKFTEYPPVDGNDTPENLAHDRRVDIAIQNPSVLERTPWANI
jgi:hypothetical protein